MAARNVLVGEGEKCKVTDFGMARDVHQDDIYIKKSPVGTTLGIYKLSGLGTLIKRQMSFSYLKGCSVC